LTIFGWAVAGSLVLFLGVSFADWQSLDGGAVTATMWHGFGVLAGVLALALAVLMGIRASGLQLGPALPLQLPTLALSALLALCTFIRVLNLDGRTAFAWIGLALALIVFLAAYLDARALLRMFRAMRSGRIPGAPSAFTPPPQHDERDSMIDGVWQCTIDTPMGVQQVQLTLATDGTDLSGRADTAFGAQEFDGGTVAGMELTWHVSVTQPLPVDLDFSATIEGDQMTGMVKAGMLGEQPFTGTRA
jgi:hypothetical protein